MLVALLSLGFFHQLAYRSLVDHFGNWFAINSAYVLLVPSVIGCIVGSLWSKRYQGSIVYLVAWAAAGLGYLDTKHVSDVVSGSMFSLSSVPLNRASDVEASYETISDFGILRRCVFVCFATSWVPVSCLGFLVGAYGRHLNIHKSGNIIVLWLVLLSHISSLKSTLPMGPVLVYPDCSIPLLGVVLCSIGFAIQLPKTTKMVGSVVVVAAIAHALNSYLSCKHCGVVPETTLSRNHGHGLLKVSWKCPLRLGNFVQIIEGSPRMSFMENLSSGMELRAMRLSHSVMGGYWTKPQSIKGVSIFSAFHLQATGALFQNHNRTGVEQKSLSIGLGVGGSIKLLQEMGYSCDCIEIHAEVLNAAREYFNLNGTTCQIGDANDLINKMPLESYDVIIIDIFSGDIDMTFLQRLEFFQTISRASMLSKGSIIVVNYFGIEGQQLRLLYKAVRESFRAVRVYREEADMNSISNFVVIASNSDDLLSVNPSTILQTEPYYTIFADHMDLLVETLEKRELTTSQVLHSGCNEYQSLIELCIFKACVWKENLRIAGAQWRSFRQQFY